MSHSVSKQNENKQAKPKQHLRSQLVLSGTVMWMALPWVVEFVFVVGVVVVVVVEEFASEMFERSQKPQKSGHNCLEKSDWQLSNCLNKVHWSRISKSWHPRSFTSATDERKKRKVRNLNHTSYSYVAIKKTDDCFPATLNYYC